MKKEKEESYILKLHKKGFLFMFFKSVKRNVDVEKKKRLNWEKLVAGFGF